MFQHQPIYDSKNFELKEVYNSEGKRFYKTMEGFYYPSVTTVLSLVKEDVINAWKERIGEEEANKIKNSASSRGSQIHAIAEDYLNDKLDSKKYPSIHRLLFNQLKPILNEVEIVHNLEIPLYSDYLKLAGRCDLIAKWRGKKTVIDFKTSKRKKKKEDISNYFMQATAYAIMFEERTGVPIKNLAVLIAVDDDTPQVYIEDRDNWIRPLLHYREKYGYNYGTIEE